MKSINEETENSYLKDYVYNDYHGNFWFGFAVTLLYGITGTFMLACGHRIYLDERRTWVGSVLGFFIRLCLIGLIIYLYIKGYINLSFLRK